MVMVIWVLKVRMKELMRSKGRNNLEKEIVREGVRKLLRLPFIHIMFQPLIKIKVNSTPARSD